jgi:hypothetical protein
LHLNDLLVPFQLALCSLEGRKVTSIWKYRERKIGSIVIHLVSDTGGLSQTEQCLLHFFQKKKQHSHYRKKEALA